MIGYNLRFLPSLIEFKKLIKSNKIGKIYSVRSEFGQHLPSWRPESDYRSGVSAQNSLGGGALLELSHEIDYLTWIFGKVEWVKAHASKQSDLNIDVEDTALVVLGFVKRGNKALTASLNIDFIRHDTTRKCYVIGEYGTLMWDGINGEVNFFEKDSSQWKNLFSHKPNRYLTYTKEVKSFFASVDSKKTPEITGEDGLIAVKIVEAIKRSSDNNSIVYCN
jgi:predicted dehydrogenase